MVVENKYLQFNELDFPERKTKVFQVVNKQDDFFLGTIEWDTAWRRYIFSGATEPNKLDSNCLKTIACFIDSLIAQRNDPKSGLRRTREKKNEIHER